VTLVGDTLPIGTHAMNIAKMTRATGAVNMDTKEVGGMIIAVINGKVATRTIANADEVMKFEHSQAIILHSSCINLST